MNKTLKLTRPEKQMRLRLLEGRLKYAIFLLAQEGYGSEKIDKLILKAHKCVIKQRL